MNVFLLMLAVTACYTITSLSDKYAIAKAHFSGNEFTLLMCSSLALFIGISLPFQNIWFIFTWQSFVAIGLIAVCKMLEFQMSALVLKQLSAFELKAWLGTTLFASYITDVFYGSDLYVSKLVFILLTVLGLIFIAKASKKEKTDYRKILLPLVLYLFSKYGYGLVIKSFSAYASSSMQLLPALVLITLFCLTKVNPLQLIRDNPKGTGNVILARIPNAVGILLENAVISISLASYSFIQPMILVTLFIIGLLRKEQHTTLNLIGSLLCIIGVIAFQLAG